MSDRWVIDEDYPGGHLVAMTRVEQAQCDADQKAGVAETARSESLRANEAALSEALKARMETLRKARVEMSRGKLFASLSSSERQVMDALLQGDLQSARLTLGLFDATED